MKKLLILLLLAPAALGDTLLILSKGDNTLSFVDLTRRLTVRRITVGEGPHEVAVTGDGRTAIVTNYGTGPKPGTSLSIVDVPGQRERRRFELPGLTRPHGVHADGARVYFTAEGSKAAARYDAAKERIDWIAGSGQEATHMIVASRDGRKVYTSNIASHTVTVFDLSEWPRKMPVRQIAVGKGPEGIDLSPDGRELWVAHRGDGGISIIDTASERVVATITGGKVPIRLKFTPDGKRVLLTDPPAGELIVLDAVRREFVARIPVDAQPVGLLVAPDSRRAWVACSGAAKVMMINLDTLTVAGSIATGNQPDGLAYVP